MVHFFLSAGLKSVVIVFFEGDALVVESAHLWASVCDDALTSEFAFLVGEARVAAIECHGPELRHFEIVYIVNIWKKGDNWSKEKEKEEIAKREESENGGEAWDGIFICELCRYAGTFGRSRDMNTV